MPFDLGQRTQSITPEALTDVPQDAVNGQTALDVSDNRGRADEEVSVVSPEGGTYTVQIAGFEGATARSVGAADREDRPRSRCRARAPTAPPRHGRHQANARRADDRETLFLVA